MNVTAPDNIPDNLEPDGTFQESLVTPNQARVAQPRYYISRRIPFRVQGTSRLSWKHCLPATRSTVFVNLSP